MKIKFPRKQENRDKMKNTKLLLISLALIFLISLVSFASAASVITNIFYDSTTERNATIPYGEQIGLIISADSIFEDNMTLSVDLLDSNGDFIRNLLSVFTTSDSYSNYIILGPTLYNSTGDYKIISTITAASGQTDTDELTLSVNAPATGNNAPVIISIPVTQVNESQVYVYQVTATDADNDALTYTLTQNPSWLSINSGTGLISGTAPSVDSNTDFAVTVQVSDGEDTATQFYVITVLNVISPPINNAPVTTSTPITSVNESTAYSYQVTATDADGDSLIYFLTQAPGWLTIDSNGLVSGTAPSVNANTDFPIIILVSDGQASATQSYVLTVIDISAGNNAPIITSTPITSVDENAQYSYQVTATDADGDTLTYSFSGPSWLSINANTGLVSGTAPSVSSDAQFTITITVSDGTDSATQTYTLTVNDVSGTGGTGGKKGGGGVKIIPANDFENQKYLDQFGPINAAEEETKTPEQKSSFLKALLILIWIVVFLLLIALAVLLVRRIRRK